MVQYLKTFVNFFVFTNIYVAIPVASLAFQTYLINKEATDWVVIFLIYSATLFLYTFHRLMGVKNNEKDISERHVWAMNHRYTLLMVALFSGILTIYFTMCQPNLIIWLIPASIIAGGYVIPFKFSINKGRVFRDIPYMKSVLVALVVTYISTIIPSIGFSESEISSIFCLDTLGRFFFILAITIPFDIRDVQIDRAYGLQTFVTEFGEVKAMNLSLFCLLASMILYTLAYNVSLLSFALIISIAITAIVTRLTTKYRSEYYYSLAVEGTMILQTCLVYIVLV